MYGVVCLGFFYILFDIFLGFESLCNHFSPNDRMQLFLLLYVFLNLNTEAQMHFSGIKNCYLKSRESKQMYIRKNILKFDLKI